MGFLAANATPTLKALPGAEVLSEVCFCQYKGDEVRTTMPGSTFFTNAAGGKVIVSAMNIKEWHYMHVLNPGRKLQYAGFLKLLGGVPCYIPEPQDARISCGFLPGGALVCALFNYSYDPLPVCIAVEKAVQKFERLNSDGSWEEIPFTFADGMVQTELSQEPAVVGVYRLS
jgi:hypothetical protein